MKLKSVTFGFYNSKGFEQFKVDIGVAKDDGTFYFLESQIPQCIREIAGKTLSEAFGYGFHSSQGIKFSVPTYDEISRGMEKAISDFETALKLEGSEKVILYMFRLQGDLTPDKPSGSESIRYNDLKGADGDLGLMLDWEVVSKNRVGGRVEYFTIYEDSRPEYEGQYRIGNSRDRDGRHEMVWSEQREIWFKELEKGLIGMMTRIHNFIQIDPEHLQIAIDTGKLPLMLTGAGEKPLPKKKRRKS